MAHDVIDYVFQCEYCAAYVPVDQVINYFDPRRELDDGRTLVSMGTYCSRFCGEHASLAVSGR
jgi:hypothetical protein